MTRLEEAIQFARNEAERLRQQALMEQNGSGMESFDRAQALEKKANKLELLADYASIGRAA